jgi:protein-L-isoaspartate(D-aspartate) O-methyltransferase
MPDPRELDRLSMVATQLRRRGIHNERVLSAMEKVPRHEFIPPHLHHAAYDDNPVPIGEGQTVSQPYIVAYMLQALEVWPDHRVLEVGTGTGYQAALLGELAHEVFTIERVPSLFVAAQDILSKLGYTNVTAIHGDGTHGLPDRAPFDRIIVAAAAPDIPSALFHQLTDSGRMIIPVGSPDMQELLLVRKQNGERLITKLEGVRFVPLIGTHGFKPAV